MSDTLPLTLPLAAATETLLTGPKARPLSSPRATAPGRTSRLPVDELFLGRWSPRSFRPDPVPREDLLTLFEAARWAPSSNNEQPWLFVYATGPADRERFLRPLARGNRAWAEGAPVLAFLFARRSTRDGRPYRTSGFDTGAAWMALALQARIRGLDTHPMGGFDAAAAFEVTGVDPERYDAMIALAIGRRGPVERLPAPFAEREHPSDRLPLEAIAHEGALAPGAPRPSA